MKGVEGKANVGWVVGFFHLVFCLEAFSLVNHFFYVAKCREV